MPKTCEECREQNAHTEDPMQCTFGECPRKAFMRRSDYWRLGAIYQFAMLALCSWDHKDDLTGEVNKKYGIEQNLQQFMAACRIKRVPESQLERALEWVGLVAKAANEAPDVAMMELLNKRRRPRG